MKRQNICETVGIALRMTDYAARTNHVSVLTDLEPPAVLITYDARQLELVLVNVIQNAIQAMPDGGQLRLAVRQAAEWVEITVDDTGVGIPAEHLGRIFEPFFSTKDGAERRGLGLSVVRGIIRQHNGQLDVQSEVGRGTTLRIRLPRGPADRRPN